jgi:hypothetical protein
MAGCDILCVKWVTVYDFPHDLEYALIVQRFNSSEGVSPGLPVFIEEGRDKIWDNEIFASRNNVSDSMVVEECIISFAEHVQLASDPLMGIVPVYRRRRTHHKLRLILCWPGLNENASNVCQSDRIARIVAQCYGRVRDDDNQKCFTSVSRFMMIIHAVNPDDITQEKRLLNADVSGCPS